MTHDDGNGRHFFESDLQEWEPDDGQIELTPIDFCPIFSVFLFLSIYHHHLYSDNHIVHLISQIQKASFKKIYNEKSGLNADRVSRVSSTMTSADKDDDFIEHVTTPLNACSLESIPDPIEIDGSGKNSVWPLMLGCYELDETTGQRRGRLDLFTVPVPDDKDDADGKSLTQISSLGTPTNVLGGEEDSVVSGILDGKWYQRQQANHKENFYATAHASGEIIIHKVEEAIKNTNGSSSNEAPLVASQVGTSESKDSALCLALSWDMNCMPDVSPRIISSYSNGQVSIHNVHFQNENKVQLVEQDCWDAHKMFHCPAEVWSACFTPSNSNVVLTGGDEGYLKIWDLRAGTSHPMHNLKNNFQAGVTVLSPHPRKEYMVACGSYDETIALLDLRQVSECQPKAICQSDPLGGGMWRIKWHPLDDNRMLLGAMHGGCRVVKLDGLESLEEENLSMGLHVEQKFTNHKSMAYGADWLVCKRQGSKGWFQAAVSCSFYDRAMYLWQVA